MTKRLDPHQIAPLDDAGDPVADGQYVMDVVDGQITGLVLASTSTGVVETIVEGDGIDVDSTDPANPIVTVLVPVVLLPAASDASDVPVGTAVPSIILVKA